MMYTTLFLLISVTEAAKGSHTMIGLRYKSNTFLSCYGKKPKIFQNLWAECFSALQQSSQMHALLAIFVKMKKIWIALCNIDTYLLLRYSYKTMHEQITSCISELITLVRALHCSGSISVQRIVWNLVPVPDSFHIFRFRFQSSVFIENIPGSGAGQVSSYHI